MSTEANEANLTRQILLLDPEVDILIPDESDVRPFSSRTKDSEKEMNALTELGKSIADNGQLQPIVVTPNITGGGPKYALVAGRRRLKGVRLYNLGAEKTIRIEAVVDRIAHDKKRPAIMFRHALHENVHRAQLNPMDFAFDVRHVRAKYGDKKDAATTQKIAEFFGVSPATITQSEKLLTLPEDLQAMVSVGELSSEAALETLKHAKTPEQRKEVVAKAKQLQAAEEQEVTSIIQEGMIEAGLVEPEGEATQRKKRKARKTAAVKTKHVRAAAREVTGASTKRGRSELLDFFRGQLGPANGFPNGSIHLFCDGILSWAEGKVSDKKLNALWDDLVEKAYRGKKEAEAPVAAKVAAGPARKAGSAGKPAPKKKAAKPKKKK